MLSKLKKFVLGDGRPLALSVDHPVIGTLAYSDDAEAWLTDPRASTCGFGFYISGDWSADHPEIYPAAALIDHAAEIALHPKLFTQSVHDFIESQLQSVRSHQSDRAEIERLQVYRVALMWPDRPNDGEIELRASCNPERTWGCAYIARKPAPDLGFTGLDQ